MSDPKRMPLNEAPDWVQRIADQEQLLPEELAKAKAGGNQVWRAIRAREGNFLLCFDQETGEATDIVWL